MKKKYIFMIILAIIVYIINCVIILFELGVNLLKTDSDAMEVKNDILNNYQEEIKAELKNVDIIVPEEAKIISITNYTVWNDDTFIIRYDNNGTIKRIKTNKIASKMPKIIMNNLEKKDSTEIIQNIRREIIELIIMFILPIIILINYKKVTGTS